MATNKELPTCLRLSSLSRSLSLLISSFFLSSSSLIFSLSASLLVFSSARSLACSIGELVYATLLVIHHSLDKGSRLVQKIHFKANLDSSKFGRYVHQDTEQKPSPGPLSAVTSRYMELPLSCGTSHPAVWQAAPLPPPASSLRKGQGNKKCIITNVHLHTSQAVHQQGPWIDKESLANNSKQQPTLWCTI